MNDDRAAKFAASLTNPTTQTLALGLGVGENVALSDASIRRSVSRWIITLFVVANIATIGLIIGLSISDEKELAAGLIKPDERLINSQVLTALLGASTVQLGIISVIMAKYIFKKPG